jgi:hypothetical protein
VTPKPVGVLCGIFRANFNYYTTTQAGTGIAKDGCTDQVRLTVT